MNYSLSLLSQQVEISNELFDSATVLEDFAVEIRYPDTSIDLTDDDILQAFKIAKIFRDFVLNRMNLTIDYQDFKKE